MIPLGPTPGGRTPGFQASENTSAELTLYASGSGLFRDPILTEGGKRLEFVGRSADDEAHSVISITTAKQMGAPSGQWSAVVKSSQRFRDVDLRDQVVDDQWCDIVFKVFNRPFATMRGSVDRIQRMRSVGGTGATTTTYLITGRDFGKVWEMTPIWFNRFSEENVVGAASLRVLDSVNVSGPVNDTVRAFLFGFLEELEGRGRANWQMPEDMPGVERGSAFAPNVSFDDTGFSNDPARTAVSPNFMDPDGGMAWALAQEWSDPAFCEMWVDTLPAAQVSESAGIGLDLGIDVELPTIGTPETLDVPTTDVPNPGDLFRADFSRGLEEQITVEDVRMAVILRDRPFPTVRKGRDSAYFSLPMAEIQREEIIDDTLTRGGDERYNAFFVSPQVLQGYLLQGNVDVTAPLWDTEDMKIHGLRRFDINSRYVAEVGGGPDLGGLNQTGSADNALLTITQEQREKVRDWYAINPYLYSGDIKLGHGRPDIRVGTKIRIPGFAPERDETYYVESVQHDWEFGSGLKTTLGVTRGWIGTDDAYMSAIETLARRYTTGQGQDFGLDFDAGGGLGGGNIPGLGGLIG